MSEAKIELSATRAREAASGYRWTMTVAGNSDDAAARFTAISSGIFETFAEAIDAARLALSEIRNSTEIKTLE